jgi:hypothetical protein
MRLKATVAVIGILLAREASAQQQRTVTMQTEAGAPAECSDFQKNPNGSWTPTKDITISASGCTLVIGAGQVSFQPGMPAACGADIGFALNQKCGKR